MRLPWYLHVDKMVRTKTGLGIIVNINRLYFGMIFVWILLTKIKFHIKIGKFEI